MGLSEGRSLPGSRNSKCQSPEVSACWSVQGGGRAIRKVMGSLVDILRVLLLNEMESYWRFLNRGMTRS